MLRGPEGLECRGWGFHPLISLLPPSCSGSPRVCGSLLSPNTFSFLTPSSARPPGPTAPSSCPVTPSGTGCWPRRGCAMPSSPSMRPSHTCYRHTWCPRSSPWLRCASCPTATPSSRSVAQQDGPDCAPSLQVPAPGPGPRGASSMKPVPTWPCPSRPGC